MFPITKVGKSLGFLGGGFSGFFFFFFFWGGGSGGGRGGFGHFSISFKQPQT